MKKATGEQQEIAYKVDCPECGTTSYSDISHKEWSALEWDNGTPEGVLKCKGKGCGKEFQFDIE